MCVCIISDSLVKPKYDQGPLGNVARYCTLITNEVAYELVVIELTMK